MINLSQVAILEKNKIEGESAWILLLEITVTSGVLYLCRNNENINWKNKIWTAFPFEVDPPRQSSSGELPNFTVRVSNVTRAVEAYLEQAGGGVGARVRLMVVMSEHLDETTPVMEEEFSVQSTSYDEQWVTFSLSGATNLYRRIPERRYLKNFCPFQYKGPECKSSSYLYTCNKSFSDCLARNNTERFGGEPAIPQGGLYVAH